LQQQAQRRADLDAALASFKNESVDELFVVNPVRKDSEPAVALPSFLGSKLKQHQVSSSSRFILKV
jgi:hypothetical protein